MREDPPHTPAHPPDRQNETFVAMPAQTFFSICFPLRFASIGAHFGRGACVGQAYGRSKSRFSGHLLHHFPHKGHEPRIAMRFCYMASAIVEKDLSQGSERLR